MVLHQVPELLEGQQSSSEEEEEEEKEEEEEAEEEEQQETIMDRKVFNNLDFFNSNNKFMVYSHVTHVVLFKRTRVCFPR